MASSGIHVVVTGVVQMVGYRWFAINSAKDLELTGWVKNLDDGSVEINAFGNKSMLEEFVKQLNVGPKFSNVSDVRVRGIEYKVTYTDFMVEK
ncbi:MAG: acylphosphatase [Candidatus Marinimicrobia bacterium]|nr:acylphosphatase [Candidatus Neomarinimicrobiota bacterium]MCH7955036.1 acylphosphatase [Candidatus Neomarinimicrobiota bacterium]